MLGIRCCLWWVMLGSVFLGFGFPRASAAESGRTVVVWISIDGMRGDYVERGKTPFLRRLMAEGAFSRQLTPVFPSLTFPTHVSQVTGALVNRHGIIANAIYDPRQDRRWNYPNMASEILCEPIWTTAKRQDRRVLVYDWPVSQNQAGQHAADYFDPKFNTELSDRERLARLIETWKKDDSPQPLQLLMGYVAAVDKAGHKYGPDASETRATIEETDAALGEFFAQCEALFREKMKPEDTLWLLISTDHGMDDVHTILNLEKLVESARLPEMRFVTSGSVGHIFLERLGPPPQRAPHVERLLKALEGHPFLHAYRREYLPAEWGYDHPTRTGDVVASLDTGYMFADREGPAIAKIDPARGPLGMHGYPQASNPKMLGFLAAWSSRGALGGKDLGPVDCRQLHATVAQWLEIAPAATALEGALLAKPQAAAGGE